MIEIYGRSFTYRAAYGRPPSGRVPEMMTLPIALLVALLVMSGLFSALETAYTSLTPGQVSALAENRGKRGKLVKKLNDRPDILLTTLLIGNNIANLGASAITTTMTLALFGNAYVAVSTGVLTLTVLVFCEVSPKQIALEANEALSIHSARSILILSWLLRPFIWIISGVSRTITRFAVGKERKLLTLENLLHHVKVAEGQGVVESFEEEMVRNVFRINDTPVEAIMTHRTELYSIDEETSISNALDGFLKSGHSRAPVMKSDSEHVLGVVTLGAVAAALKESPDSPIRKYATAPYLVPGTLKAHELFLRLKREPIHMAVVLDEYGGLDGVVTREDVMEEIFGELYDEREPTAEEPIRQEEDGSWIIQGDADFYDVNDILGLRLEHDSRTHTIGGYLLEKLEHIPKSGTTIELPEGVYTILETYRQRIVTVRFTSVDTDDD
ncbi:MAG: hemolysin family protein [Spirochaetaceae bacterium]|nr:hemolysin family protein [Spirochaetaceae bacterium]MDT8299063.1 hemolysin family protein [Spirochaetaceae bacterium]